MPGGPCGTPVLSSSERLSPSWSSLRAESESQPAGAPIVLAAAGAARGQARAGSKASSAAPAPALSPNSLQQQAGVVGVAGGGRPAKC